MKTDPCLVIFFIENGTHVEGFLVEKQLIRTAHPHMYLDMQGSSRLNTKVADLILSLTGLRNYWSGIVHKHLLGGPDVKRGP